ncbi:IS3 family transposase [Amycolatopsis sp. Poz14]|uniref:IS3 family transposase n=1 Tax=Amycolatopsis sp. Poz14 TaxID=1447705 RepID=UPI0003AA6570|nr:IS3 family transposase [Amycolatopsis sp. Poz14]MCG3750487.1 IS3 family transposase [Amycolatopsis sp. Poz14]
MPGCLDVQTEAFAALAASVVRVLGGRAAGFAGESYPDWTARRTNASEARRSAQPVGEEEQGIDPTFVVGVVVAAIHDESNGTYGTPRLHAELRHRGRRHSRKRIARLLRAAGRAGRAPKPWRTTTVPDPGAHTPADLIKRDFSCSTSDINTRWCGDITYIRTWEGWLYLATVIDLGSRRVVGWATADHLRTDLIADALNNAVAQRRPEPGVIFHFDRGCQYTPAQFGALADEHGARLSVGRKGQCWPNAVAESFFATIKAELLDRRGWPTRVAAHKAIFGYIEGWYNTRRLHSSLGYLSPNTYEPTHRIA